MAHFSSMLGGWFTDLGNCPDLPAKDGQIELEWSKLGEQAPRVAGIETSTGRRARNLRRLDSCDLLTQSQMGSQRRTTGNGMWSPAGYLPDVSQIS